MRFSSTMSVEKTVNNVISTALKFVPFLNCNFLSVTPRTFLENQFLYICCGILGFFSAENNQNADF